MNARKIVDRPPDMTGDPKADVKALAEYLEKMREEINYILSLIYKQL